MNGERGPHAAVADVVDAAIRGQLAADQVLERIRLDTAHPDQIHMAAMVLWSQHGTPGLQGFHRRLQKRLERLPG